MSGLLGGQCLTRHAGSFGELPSGALNRQRVPKFRLTPHRRAPAVPANATQRPGISALQRRRLLPYAMVSQRVQEKAITLQLTTWAVGCIFLLLTNQLEAPFKLATKPPLSLLIGAYSAQEIDLSKSRPRNVTEIEFGVHALP